MAAYVYSSTFFPEVRAVIGLDVTADSVPDTTLNLSVYKGEAERFIMQNLTEAQWSDAGQAAAVNAAATYYLASLVTPTLRVVTSETMPGGNMSFAAINLQAIADRLRVQAEQRISAIISAVGGSPPVRAMPFVFTTAKRTFL